MIGDGYGNEAVDETGRLGTHLHIDSRGSFWGRYIEEGGREGGLRVGVGG